MEYRVKLGKAFSENEKFEGEIVLGSVDPWTYRHNFHKI